MFNIVLHQPEIPPNTGNIIRLCANTGAKLHLIHPLGFVMSKKNLERAALDYGESVEIIHHKNFDAYLENTQFSNYYAVSTKGKSPMNKTLFCLRTILCSAAKQKDFPKSVSCMKAVRES